MKSILTILQKKKKINIDVITKCDPIDLALGVSEIEAFEYIYKKNIYEKWNIDITIVRNLHAKAIVLGTKAAIIGSANLTYGGLYKNKELCVSIQNETAKIENIRRKVQEIKKAAGIPLTPELFEWEKVTENQRLKNQISKLIEIQKQIKRKKETYLMSFIPGKIGKDEECYFGGVINSLEKLAQKPVSRKSFASWLTKKAEKHGVQISEQRILFLESLCLVIEDQYGMHFTSEGIKLKKGKSKTKFYELLVSEYTGFNDLEIQLDKNDLIHPDDLGSSSELYVQREYWAKRLRWLSSLGLVTEEMLGKKKYYQKMSNNVYWGKLKK